MGPVKTDCRPHRLDKGNPEVALPGQFRGWHGAVDASHAPTTNSGSFFTASALLSSY